MVKLSLFALRLKISLNIKLLDIIVLSEHLEIILIKKEKENPLSYVNMCIICFLYRVWETRIWLN